MRHVSPLGAAGLPGPLPQNNLPPSLRLWLKPSYLLAVSCALSTSNTGSGQDGVRPPQRAGRPVGAAGRFRERMNELRRKKPLSEPPKPGCTEDCPPGFYMTSCGSRCRRTGHPQPGCGAPGAEAEAEGELCILCQRHLPNPSALRFSFTQ
uniref:Uncharacterized protein n=1 Tax=Myotis myotis TaxID=51298 RepID=A0A7J7Z5A9_MYOMY|nr:hypothetical protein mMyoMyo1_010770 [Myotis myotis]